MSCACPLLGTHMTRFPNLHCILEQSASPCLGFVPSQYPMFLNSKLKYMSLSSISFAFDFFEFIKLLFIGGKHFLFPSVIHVFILFAFVDVYFPVFCNILYIRSSNCQSVRVQDAVDKRVGLDWSPSALVGIQVQWEARKCLVRR